MKKNLGIENAYNGEDFKDFNLDLTKFEKVIFETFPEDVGENRNAKGDLFELMQQFKEKAKIPEDYSKDEKFTTSLYYQITGALREIKTEEEMDLLAESG